MAKTLQIKVFFYERNLIKNVSIWSGDLHLHDRIFSSIVPLLIVEMQYCILKLTAHFKCHKDNEQKLEMKI